MQESAYGVFALVEYEANDTIKYETAYWACKGSCDKALQKKYHSKAKRITAWTDISDLLNPLEFLKFNMEILNRIYKGIVYEKDAFEKIKLITLRSAQFTIVEPTDEERFINLAMLRDGVKDIIEQSFCIVPSSAEIET